MAWIKPPIVSGGGGGGDTSGLQGQIDDLTGRVDDLETGGGGLPSLIEITNTTALSAGETKTVTLATGFDKYDLRTINASATNAALIVISVLDKAAGGSVVYKSNQGNVIADIATVPISDKAAAKSIYVQIENKSAAATSVSMILKITSLN